jgi:AraC family transcriptional regulator, transcriptional activator of pobA
MTQDLHRHDFFFILALKKGRGNHEIDFVSHAISDNSIFVLRPGQVHRLTLKTKREGYLMEFGNRFFSSTANSDLLRKAASKCFCQLEAATANKLQAILNSIHEEYRNKNEGFQEVIKANLSIFFIELIRQRHNLAKGKNTHIGYGQQRLEDFLELLERDITEQKQVSHYTEKLNLSQFQLNSICKTLLGKSAARLIDDQILLEAKRYLLATSNQVNQISYYLGYEDVSYFIRFFKKHTGQTPEMFRQNFR